MKQGILSQFLLYRYRYVTGYILFALLLLGAVTVSTLVPNQLTAQERASAVKSASLSISNANTQSVMDVPYHALQKTSLHFFGITEFAIKLPSLIIGMLTGIGIFFLMRRWLMRPSIALMVSLIAITSSQYLSTTSTGTPLIMPIFWMVSLILVTIHLANRPHSLWLYVAFAVLAGMSLYTPLSVYLLMSIVLATALHPRLRFLLKKAPIGHVLIAFIIGLVVVAPLAVAIVKNSDILVGLAGWPDGVVSRTQIKMNLIELGKAFLLFWKPNIGALGLTPLFAMPVFILIILGGLRLLGSHYMARSYQLLILVPLLVVPVILDPRYVVILFVPLIMLMARGIEVLMDEWYKLFPHNPYARIAVLVPIIILLSGIVFSNFNHYLNSYHYSQRLPFYYSRDLSLLRSQLELRSTSHVVTTTENEGFYALLKRDYPDTEISAVITSDTNIRPVIFMSGVNQAQLGAKVPRTIVVDEYKNSLPRFYIFTD